MLGLTTLGWWLLFALLTWSAPLSCELQTRTAWAFAAAAATACACLPITLVPGRAAAVGVALVMAAIGFAGAWIATVALFPDFC